MESGLELWSSNILGIRHRSQWDYSLDLFAWKYIQEPNSMYGKLCWNANWTHFVGTCRGFSLLHNFSKVCYISDSHCLLFKSLNPLSFSCSKGQIFFDNCVQEQDLLNPFIFIHTNISIQ